ncbi:hypothetical protein APHAL10511_006873 [Amanita phalloides]|nr:hypothetical protein APHAL10511_006873 [Amanita phalloides]
MSGIMFALLTIIILIFHWLRRIRPTTNSTVAFSSSRRIQALVSDLELRVKKVQDDFSDLERRYYLHNFQEIYTKFVRPGSCAAPLQHHSIRNRRRERISSLCAGYKIDALDTSRMSGAFVSFCERLLAMNCIWEQEKQIKKLQSDETSRLEDSCNKLPLYNKVWQLEGQVENMGLEVTMSKRKLAATMKRAARKKYERLIQNRVKNMNVETGSCKLALGTLNALHDRKLTWEWQQDCWNLSREVEKLNLARQSFVEHMLVDVPTGDEDKTISSLTCVSSDSRGVNSPTRKGLASLSRMPMIPCNIRSARWVGHSKRQRLTWPKRLILGNHTGFSFNPLFYGPKVSPQALTSHQRSYGKRKGVIGTIIHEARRQAGHAHVRSSVAQWKI